jgi:hypothetical protein
VCVEREIERERNMSMYYFMTVITVWFLCTIDYSRIPGIKPPGVAALSIGSISL